MRFAALVVVIVLAGCTDTIFVNSVPQGGAVLVDEKELGATPCSIEVRTSQKVVVRKAGFHDYKLVFKETTDPLLALMTIGIAGTTIEKSYCLNLNPLDTPTDPAPSAPTPPPTPAPSKVVESAAPTPPPSKVVESAAPTPPPSKVVESAAPSSTPKRFCTECGATVDEKSKFCGSCGAKR